MKALLDITQDIGGSPKSAHLKQAIKTLGKEKEAPNVDHTVVPPYGAEFVWLEFWKIRKGDPLTYTEIEAYCRLTDTRFEPWELEAIRVMNDAVMEWYANERHSNAGN